MKHTPGPWKRQNYRIYASQMANPEYPIHAPKRGLIAKAYREADANIMAAAPELLDALEEAALALKDSGKHEHAQMIRETIAKATGEKQ